MRMANGIGASPARGLTLLTAILVLCFGFAGTPARAQDQVDKKVTLNLKDTPLRDAVSLLFAGSGLQYSIDPNVPNVPVNLNIKDVGLQAALRMMVRQAAVASPGLTFSRDGDVYVVKIRTETPKAPESTGDLPPETTANDPQELTWEKIPVQFNDVMVFVLAFGGTMLPTEADVKMGGMNGGMGGYGGGMGGMNGGMGGFGGGMMGGMGGFGGGMMGGMGGFGGGMGGMMGGMGGFGGGNFGGGYGGRRF